MAKTFFDKRIRSKAEFQSKFAFQPISGKQFLDIANNSTKNKKSRDTGLIYFHIPFCTQLCEFCGYYRTSYNKEKVVKYIDTLKNHITKASEIESFKSKNYIAVFFGGGSPGCIDEKHICELLKTVKQHFSLSDSCEITIEFTLGNITQDKLENLYKCGINRISCGVQSFNSELRKNIGRKLNAKDVENSIDMVANSKFQNVYIDLIYNLPGQTTALWEFDLQKIKEFPIAGVSLYPMILFPNSKMAAKGNYTYPDIEQEFTYFQMADEFLLNFDQWKSFTPVQYGHEINGSSEYVRLAAQNADILAFGCGAGGYMNNVNYLYARELDLFIQNTNASLFDQTMFFQIDDEFASYFEIFNLAAGSTIHRSVLNNFPVELKNCIDQLIEKELVNEESGYLFLTQNGRFWSANIYAFLVDKARFIMEKK